MMAKMAYLFQPPDTRAMAGGMYHAGRAPKGSSG